MVLDACRPTILVTGGAGYIGSNTVLLLIQKGYQVVVVDNYRHGQQFNPSWENMCIIKGDYSDPIILDQLFMHYNVKAVMHFAGLLEVGLSVNDPLLFYRENIAKLFNLLEKMREYTIDTFIFSSSAAVYGIPEYAPISENHPCNPINPYGNTKHTIEKILQDSNKAYGIRFVALRYFNASGADVEHMLGEQHNPETHVIPILLKAVASRSEFFIFGDNYNTSDGTCVRDYLHVKDIAMAHYQALEYLQGGNQSNIFNLGTGCGISVQELVITTQTITGVSINTRIKERRSGDPDYLIADASKALRVLHWKPQHSSIEEIIADSWLFSQRCLTVPNIETKHVSSCC